MILCAGPLCVACCVVLITRNWGKKKVKKNCQLSSSFFLWTLYCNIIILALTPYYEMASAFFEINCFTYRHYCWWTWVSFNISSKYFCKIVHPAPSLTHVISFLALMNLCPILKLKENLFCWKAIDSDKKNSSQIIS